MKSPEWDHVKQTPNVLGGKMKHYLKFITVLVVLAYTVPGFGYPLDAYHDTGIRRVEAARRCGVTV